MLWRAFAVYILLVNILLAILGVTASSITETPSVSAKVMTWLVDCVSPSVGPVLSRSLYETSTPQIIDLSKGNQN